MPHRPAGPTRTSASPGPGIGGGVSRRAMFPAPRAVLVSARTAICSQGVEVDEDALLEAQRLRLRFNLLSICVGYLQQRRHVREVAVPLPVVDNSLRVLRRDAKDGAEFFH